MALRRLGHEIDQDDVFDRTGVDPFLGRGAYAREMMHAATSIGFKPGAGWYSVAADQPKALEAQLAALVADLRRGIPSIICMRYDDQPKTTEHFRLVVGYDSTRKEVLYHEPAEADGAYRRMSRKAFLALWPLKYKPKQWTVIRICLEPDGLNITHGASPTDADVAQAVRRARAKIPGEVFHFEWRRPFLIISDTGAERTRRLADHTVAWAARRLKESFFAREPEEVVQAWLFKNKQSYRHHAWTVFRDRPDTPFGYYSNADRALVMNIATGGGTLVHEMVHAFVAADFPDCPAWFNEGMGSLFEQCGERKGRIVGFTNWRLTGLQRLIRDKALPRFAELASTTTHEFYSMDKGGNYAQARYLLYYLQEKGLLRRYYREFKANHASDPSGYKTLQSILGAPDMDEFQAQWEAWVLTLRFDRGAP